MKVSAFVFAATTATVIVYRGECCSNIGSQNVTVVFLNSTVPVSSERSGYEGFSWSKCQKVNGADCNTANLNLRDLPPYITVNDVLYLQAIEELNCSVFKCEVTTSNGIITPNEYLLLIQGILSSVTNLIVSDGNTNAKVLSWTPPPSLNVTHRNGSLMTFEVSIRSHGKVIRFFNTTNTSVEFDVDEEGVYDLSVTVFNEVGQGGTASSSYKSETTSVAGGNGPLGMVQMAVVVGLSFLII